MLKDIHTHGSHRLRLATIVEAMLKKTDITGPNFITTRRRREEKDRRRDGHII